MSQAFDSKKAAAVLIDPMNGPEPSAETGPGSSFGSTFAPKEKINGSDSAPTSSSRAPRPPPHQTLPAKSGSPTAVRSGGSPKEQFPAYRNDYRNDAFGGYEQTSRRNRAASHGTPPSYQEATSPSGRPRRTSSIKERYPGDKSHQPLDVIRRDSKKAYRSPHLNKRTIPGADSIDRLDPAIGGRAYHHEGPYDAALLGRNRDPRTAPIGALTDSTREALKATPAESIKDSLDHHKPLDNVAMVPPGMQDRLGRTYNYEEGADLNHEASSGDPGYKRWPGKDYDPEDLKGESEPTFSLDRALQAHKIDENGIEMEDRAHIRKDYHEAEIRGTLDKRDPVRIAGDDGRYADMEIAAANANDNDAGRHRSGSGGLSGLKKRIGSLRKKGRDD